MKISYEELLPLLRYIAHCHGYDFSQYASSSLKRRIERIMLLYQIITVEELICKLEKDTYFFSMFLTEVTVGVTEMFRDPELWQLLRVQVLPWLKELSHIRIWHAGCSTGEEVYSMAILLKEAGLLHKTEQLATDINPAALEVARQGIYAHRKIEVYQQNYQDFKGQGLFTDYFEARDINFEVKRELREQITFLQHNLVCDTSPGNFDLIVCRNVLIYFEQELQNKVFGLFCDSLPVQRFLLLGSYESLIWCKEYKQFSMLSDYYNLMQKTHDRC